MSEAKQGDTVRVHYTGRLDDGSEFDSSVGGDPMEFTIGAGQLIPGFERAVVGMSPGEKKTVKIGADDAYGDRRDDMVVNIKREELPEDIDPTVGDQLELKQGDNTFVVTITEVATETVTLDANHPLAGEDLTFDIELDDIN